jgi:hypothetical protein
MRAILSLSALVLSVGASAAPPQLAAIVDSSLALKTEPPSGASPRVFNTAPAQQDRAGVNCRGRIETARAERGLPKLQSDDAKAGEPLFIAAVDRLLDGCEVLVLRNDLSDIRPLPEFETGPGKLTPLGGQ